MTVEQQLNGLAAEMRRLHAVMEQQTKSARLIERQINRFEQQLTRQIENLVSELLSRALPEAGAVAGGAELGQLVSQLLVPRFADGGVVEGPGLVALAGEAGPEAVLPLKRGEDGQLGVSLVPPDGSSAGAVMPPVNVQITLADNTTDIESDLLSNTQLLEGLSDHLSAALAQAVASQIEDRFSAFGGPASTADLQAILRTSL